MIDSHYSTTIKGLVGEVDLFVSEESGLQMGVSRQLENGEFTSSIVDLSIDQILHMKKAIDEMIKIQLVYGNKGVIVGK